MHDGQLSIEMARKGHLGITDMLVKQLSPSITEARFEPNTSQTSANDERHELAEIVDSVVGILFRARNGRLGKTNPIRI